MAQVHLAIVGNRDDRSVKIMQRGCDVCMAQIAGFRARGRLYDYGVISIALTQPFAGTW
jgi:hypothetical protein